MNDDCNPININIIGVQGSLNKEAGRVNKRHYSVCSCHKDLIQRAMNNYIIDNKEFIVIVQFIHLLRAI